MSIPLWQEEKRAPVQDTQRCVIEVSGSDAADFLQGLWSNDIHKATAEQAVYAALLSPQGKLLVDAFIWRYEKDIFLLDIPASEQEALLKKLSLYKLRSDIDIKYHPDFIVCLKCNSDLVRRYQVSTIDPRDQRLGYRFIISKDALDIAESISIESYRQACIDYGIPSFGTDLRPGQAFILEYDFERLQGVDFRKGCYVGQEVTARMHHKTELRRALFRLETEKPLQTGMEVLSDGRVAGQIGSALNNKALALLRKDQLEGVLSVESEPVLSLQRAGVMSEY